MRPNEVLLTCITSFFSQLYQTIALTLFSHNWPWLNNLKWQVALCFKVQSSGCVCEVGQRQREGWAFTNASKLCWRMSAVKRPTSFSCTEYGSRPTRFRSLCFSQQQLHTFDLKTAKRAKVSSSRAGTSSHSQELHHDCSRSISV